MRFSNTPGTIVHLENPSISNQKCLYYIKLDNSDLYAVEVDEDLLKLSSNSQETISRGSILDSTRRSPSPLLGKSSVPVSPSRASPSRVSSTFSSKSTSSTPSLGLQEAYDAAENVPFPIDLDRTKSRYPWARNKKYYSQTAGMEQKYLKYKNKYLSLKQELGV